MMQRTDFVELYKEMTENMECTIIDPTARLSQGEKVPMDERLIGPKSIYVVSSLFGMYFVPDSKCMCEVLQTIEDRYKNDSKPPRNVYDFLCMINDIVFDYFGGSIPNKHDRMEGYYSIGHDSSIKLSDIKGKGLGACAEMATVAHNCLVVLQEAGTMTKYTSELVACNIKYEQDENENGHAFVLLKNNDETANSYILDIVNPIQDTETGNFYYGVFVLSPEELAKFKAGEQIAPITIYEKSGIQINSRTPIYHGGINEFNNILLPEDLIDASEEVINFTSQETADNLKNAPENLTH